MSTLIGSPPGSDCGLGYRAGEDPDDIWTWRRIARAIELLHAEQPTSVKGYTEHLKRGNEGDDMSEPPGAEPQAFLCHASEDKPLANRIANDLMHNGIATFFDKWEMKAGDSLRQRIDAGIGNCTHFIALLTTVSLTKPWVNAEMDAAFVRKLEGSCRFIPLRYGIAPSALPPLLRGLMSPAISEATYRQDLLSLVADIHGVNRRPPLGSAPSFVQTSDLAGVGLSPAASRIAELLLKRSGNGIEFDPEIKVVELRTVLGLPDEALLEGVEELQDRGLIKEHVTNSSDPIGFDEIWPTDRLFVEFDAALMPWNPENDARVVAAALMNGDDESVSLAEVAKRLGWPPRQLNPAVNYLIQHGLVEKDNNTMPEPFTCHWIMRTRATRRFVREHS